MTKELSPDDLAFVNAYGHAVASAPREDVIRFLDDPLNEKICDYTSIADAYEVWGIALHYAKGKA